MHLPCRDLAANLRELASTMDTRQAVLDHVHPGPRRTHLLAEMAYAIGEIEAELDAREAVAMAAVEASRA